MLCMLSDFDYEDDSNQCGLICADIRRWGSLIKLPVERPISGVLGAYSVPSQSFASKTRYRSVMTSSEYELLPRSLASLGF